MYINVKFELKIVFYNVGSYFLCNFATAFKNSVMSYNYYLQNGFDAYRLWFNKMFKLSLNGKFVGLRRLGDKLPQFINKLARILSRTSRQRPLGDVIAFSLNHISIKLYSA